MTPTNNVLYALTIKRKILKEIRDAHIAHAKWVRRAKHLVENLPVDEKMIPLDSTECQFGIWLYNDAMKYKNIPQLTQILSKLEDDHRNLHDMYLKIYKIYFLETKRSWMMNLVTQSRKEVPQKKQLEALQYYQNLEKASLMLIESLEKFEAYVLIQKDEILVTIS